MDCYHGEMDNFHSKPPLLATREILTARGPKNSVDPSRPYAFLVEDELSASGRIEPMATLFLTNRECPFHCLYCDLWKNTTDETLAPGQIPRQIEYALSQLPPAPQIKLYIEDVPDSNMAANAIGVTGGSQAHDNFMPYLCVDFIISLFGIFPSQT